MISQTLLSLSSVVITWAIMLASVYIFKSWVYAGFPVAWNRISLWLTISSLVVGLSVLLVHVVADNWLSVITSIVVPRFVCLIALHMFMVLFRSYMTIRYQHALATIKFALVLCVLYVFFILGTWATIHYASPALIHLTDMMVYFLLQGTVIGIAIVSFLLSSISKHVPMHQQAYTTPTMHNSFKNDDTDRW